ncbi:MAG: VWA domain-containing protein [Gammaproteobacteria bacterium]|nr:VWA domain-containing protein [Gammaproteobacteria bacterium]
MMETFHFAQPLWLWGLAAVPLMWWLSRRECAHCATARHKRYADPHLLPYVVQGYRTPGAIRRQVWLWALLWVIGVIAMAGPRWGYENVYLAGSSDSLVVVLDLSRSMDIADVRPSRMARARQEVDDLLRAAPEVSTGLVAFASVSHVVVPITADNEMVRAVLPSLSPDLMRWSGSRVSSALDKARRLLDARSDAGSRAMLVVTDGDLPEPGLENQVALMREAGITVHVLGVGTPEGGELPMERRRDRGPVMKPIVSRLDETALKGLAAAGGGIYRRADYLEEDTERLVAAVTSGQVDTNRGDVRRVWSERYYLPLALLMVLLLMRLRRMAPEPA